MTLRTHRVAGGGGAVLHVEETGPADGPPAVLLHGFSQCRLCWNRQFAGGLAAELRLVRVDLRGHGLSDRPRDAYGDPALWAADIAAVIAALDLDRPVLVGWSYGGVAICDYLRMHGTARIAGIHLVGAVTKLGAANKPFLGPDFRSFLRGFYSDDAEESVATLERFLSQCTRTPQTPEDFSAMLGWNVAVPPHVRAAMFARSVDNDDLLAGLDVPALVSHGAADRIVLPAAAEHHAGLLPDARLEIHAGAGHMPFWEDAGRFDRDLARFVAEARGIG